MAKDKDMENDEMDTDASSNEEELLEDEELEEQGLVDADFSELEGAATNEELGKLRLESKENRDKYLRALADLENYKKRSLKERSELLKYQGERVFYDMLEIVDNLELALQYTDADPAKLKEGLELIYKRFVDTLSKWDVKSQSSVGQDFDPSKHNALSKIPSPDHKPGSVVNELKKAYFYKDKLLRPAEVIVSDGASDQSVANEDES